MTHTATAGLGERKTGLPPRKRSKEMERMKIGLVGLGRMGDGLRQRLRRHGHEVVGFDHNPDVTDVSSLDEMVAALPSPRVVWVMVPAGEITEQVVRDVSALLGPADILIDGGNSNYRDSIRRAVAASEHDIRYLDIGTSGGVWGLENGFCLMVGGDADAFAAVRPVLADLAPPGGLAHVGGSGAGHFSKMVHNGIEYGMMQSIAEGFDLLQATDFEYDLEQLANLWNHSSVIRSWLIELAADAFSKDPTLGGLRAYVDDSGEGRWTVLEGVERGVDVSVLAQALFKRFASREENSFGLRVLAALRQEFGGHAVKTT
ncbi:MAG: phosphogluconate dehydrogenase (NAD(+)-dependent, decarboxylating) [Dehalococcoidia bacterium]